MFVGWCDVGLSDTGRAEIADAGKVIKQANITFDAVFTSVLDRCIETVAIILREIGQSNVPVYNSWRLNEKHYGELTGLNKVAIKEKYGAEQVKKWRRGYDHAPPKITKANPYYEEIISSPLYVNEPSPEEFPLTESLKDTVERVLPYWHNVIVPEIRKGSVVLICAHGNSLRGIVKVLENLSAEEIVERNIPNRLTYYYELGQDMKPVPGTSMQFLDDPQTVEAIYKNMYEQSEKKLR